MQTEHHLNRIGQRRCVLKWKVPVDDRDHPIPGRFVHADALTHNEVNVWTEVIGNAEDDLLVTYRVYGTGQPIAEGHRHVATTIAPPFVWHLFQTWPTE